MDEEKEIVVANSATALPTPERKPAETKPQPVKKQAARKAPAKKKPPAKRTPSPKRETVKHPFGTCVPLGECVCNKKGNS